MTSTDWIIVATTSACLCVGSGVLVALSTVLLYTIFSRSSYDSKLTSDSADRRKAWIQAAMMPLSNQNDYAYFPKGEIEPMLRESWGVIDKDTMDDVVRSLLANEKERAWSVCRVLLILRSAVAMKWLTNDASYKRCFSAGRSLQRAYDSWPEMCDDLLKSRRQWLGIAVDGSLDEASMDEVSQAITQLKSKQFKTVDWHTSLS